jgi:hypothetical protein
MTLDYDAAHRHKDDEDVQGIEELKIASATQADQRPDVDPDEAEIADTYELPGADLSHESLSVRVEPEQVDEFTCAGCFLVRHHSQLVTTDPMLCRDCA